MQRLSPVDVVIVGGCWTGLLIAKEITTRTALSVVVLERGAARRSSDCTQDMDEVDYVLRFRMLQNIADETITHRHSPDAVAAPIRQHGGFHPGAGLGGAGEHWTSSTFRFMPDVFRLATHLRERRGKSRVLPEGLALQDWGVTYNELEPYYWRAEQLLGVSGKVGNVQGQLREGGNIFEGERSHEYSTPPHKSSYAHCFKRRRWNSAIVPFRSVPAWRNKIKLGSGMEEDRTLMARQSSVMNARPGVSRRMGSDRMVFSEYGGTHIQGGAILGESLERSVVNTFMQHWHMPNL